MRPLTRRHLLGASATALAAGLVGAPRAAPQVRDRKFLFFFCQGGWDTQRVYNPLFGSTSVDTEPGATEANIGGLRFVDHPERPSVRTFLERHAARTCFLNGFEVRSIAHERCQRLLFTGRGDSSLDDWAAILGARAAGDYLAPSLVLSGPAFSSTYSSSVVRMGESGQLGALLDGSAPLDDDRSLALPPTSAQSAEDAYVRARVDAWTGAASVGREARIGEGYADVLDRLQRFGASAGALNGGTPGGATCSGVWSELSVAVEALAMGVARCVTVAYQGNCGATFDSHTEDSRQSLHFEEAFQHLVWLVDELEARDGPAGGSLLDEVTVVVCSEMGRHPRFNTMNGRDHWTFTSAMLVGSGVQGGLVAGGFDDDGLGAPTDLASGAPAQGGQTLLSSHFGATLLALGDVDPGAYVSDGAPVTAVLA